MTFGPDLVWLIEQASLGVYSIDLFRSSLSNIPAGPGPFTTINETGGKAPEGTHNLALIGIPAYVKPSASIIVRAEDFDVAMERAWELYLLIYAVKNRLVNGTWWRETVMTQEPFDLLADEKERARVAFNFDAVKRLSPAYS